MAPSKSSTQIQRPAAVRNAAAKSAAAKSATARSAASRVSRTSVVRRPPAKGLPLLRYKLRRAWLELLEVSPLWILLFVLVSTWCLMPRWALLVTNVEAGTIANRTYIAPDDLSIADGEATRELQRRARDEELPVYDFDRSLELARRGQLADLFESGRAILLGPEVPAADEPGAVEAPSAPPISEEDGEDLVADRLARLTEESAFKVTAEQLQLLAERQFDAELEDRLSGLLARLLRQGVVSDKELLLAHRARGITIQELPSSQRRTQLDLYQFLDYPDETRQAIDRDLLSWDGLTKRERTRFAELLFANVAPNLTSNSSASLKLKEEAATAVGTVFHTIRKGEVIIRRGGRIGELQAQAIEAMAGGRDLQRLLLNVLGTFALLGAAALLLWLASDNEQRRDRSRRRLVSECSLLLMVHLVGTRFSYFVAGAISNAMENEPFNSLISYTYAIPFASIALVSVLLYGRDLALVLSLIYSLLVGLIAGGEGVWTTMLYAVASSLAAVHALDHHQFKQRSAMTRAGAVVGVVNAAALLTLKALNGEIDGGLPQIGFDLLCGFVGGLLAAAVAAFSIPILESLLQITTAIKLIELANPNLPLLRRLALEAPGTFQHSLAVANLAKSGATAIGGDSVLINTSALYHDIGKIFRPRYFIENQTQIPGQNPHDKIQPSMSALILINHVKEGLELAHHHRLPQPIFDAIEQHHGTHLIKFFYNKALERADSENTTVREEEFRYPGPKPQSKEMGILMLADAVEAASRTLVDPSRQKIRSLLRAIFDNCLRDGQLDETDLTLGDLHQIEDAFLRVLTNIYHQRVDYPGFEFNKSPARRESSGLIERPSPSKLGTSSAAKASADDSDREPAVVLEDLGDAEERQAS